jgi:aspartate 1-decarboxylase
MIVEMCRAKIHRATVTGSELDYEGSLTIDGALMDAVGILPYEKILVSNLSNGHRFETYAIRSEDKDNAIVLNGATAHLGEVGDQIIIFSFATMDIEEARKFKPRIIVLGEGNRIIKKLP